MTEQPTVVTQPGDTLPAPDEAQRVASAPDFVKAVSVALMRVVLDGPPDIGEPGRQMCRYIVADPMREAGRFAVALATDPAIVAASLAPDARTDAAGLAQLTDKLRTIWPVMAGETGDPGFTAPPTTVDPRGTGKR